MDTKLLDYLKEKGLEVVKKADNKNFLLSPCPHCGKESTPTDRHFFVSTDGYAHCFSCGGKGNIYTYKKMYGDLGDFKVNNVKNFKNKKGKTVASWETNVDNVIDETHSMILPKNYDSVSYDFYISDKKPAVKARNYLEKVRGFDWEVLEEYSVGLAVRGLCENNTKKKNKKCDFYGIPQNNKCPLCGGEILYKKLFISIPYFDEKQSLFMVKYRSLPPNKEFQREKGGITDLFGLHLFNRNKKQAMITEAELDAIAAFQLGFKNVVSISGSKNWDDSWIQYFENVETIYLALDNDAPGKEATKKLVDRLGPFRCKIIIFPKGIKDMAKFLEHGATCDDLKKLIANAVEAGDKVWLKAGDLDSQLQTILSRGSDMFGVLTGIDGLDDLLKGIRSGESTIVTSDTGQGKSVFTNQIALKLAEKKVPSAVASFELHMEEVLMRNLSQVSGHSFFYLKNNLKNLESAMSLLNKIPYYMVNLFGEVELDILQQIIKFGVMKFGIKVIILDHLHYFLSGLTSYNERFVIDETLRSINRWAKDFNIHVILVVHPRKVSGGYKDRQNGVRIDPDMLKGSSGIKQEAYNILSLYRAKGYEAVMRNEGNNIDGAMEMTVHKARSLVASEGIRWFKFDKRSLQYTSVDREEGYSMLKVDNEGLKLKNKPPENFKADIDNKEEEEFEFDDNSNTPTGDIFDF